MNRNIIICSPLRPEKRIFKHGTCFTKLTKYFCAKNHRQWIKIPFRKKLRADWRQGMLAIVRCKIFCLPVCYPKI